MTHEGLLIECSVSYIFYPVAYTLSRKGVRYGKPKQELLVDVEVHRLVTFSLATHYGKVQLSSRLLYKLLIQYRRGLRSKRSP